VPVFSQRRRGAKIRGEIHTPRPHIQQTGRRS
jgi:hypothetical protein